MPNRSTPRQWVRAVQSCQAITDSDKVLAFELYLEMQENRRVCVARSTLAARIGRSERRVTQRITSLHEAGLLDTVHRGQKYTTAVYEGIFPNGVRLRGTDSSTLRRAGIRPPEKSDINATAVNKQSQRDPRGSHLIETDPYLKGADRNVGSNEKRSSGEPFNVDHRELEREERWA